MKLNSLAKLALPSFCQRPNLRQAHLKVEKVCRSCRRNRRGAAVVEFAVVAPVFILLVLGMLEMGRAIMVQQVIVNASREGARQAVLDGETVSTVQAKVREVLAAGAVPTSGATINVTIPNPRYNNPVSVQVSIPFSQVSWLPVPKYVNSNLTATSQMRCEAVQ